MVWARRRRATRRIRKKKLSDEALAASARGSKIPIPEQALTTGLSNRPADDSPRSAICRSAAGSWADTMPLREVPARRSKRRLSSIIRKRLTGSKGRASPPPWRLSEFCGICSKDPNDRQADRAHYSREGRTFGMESIIRQVGIYASPGAALQAARSGHWSCTYREAKDGQILEEGIHGSGLHGVVHRGAGGATRTIRCR